MDTKMKRSYLQLSAIVLLAVFCQAALGQEEFKPTTVFLVRHAEKEDEPKQDPPLKKEGVTRSQDLARILGTANIKAIYTSQFVRTKQTAEPLTAKTGVSVTALTLKPNPANPPK
jgi:phosphohistidine phosphatase SixA